MLRIRLDVVNGDEVALLLQGHIAAEWADLLEQECHELSRAGLHVVLDLSGVAFIGRSGVEALERLARAGIRVVVSPPLIAALLEQEGIAVGRTTH